MCWRRLATRGVAGGLRWRPRESIRPCRPRMRHGSALMRHHTHTHDAACPAKGQGGTGQRSSLRSDASSCVRARRAREGGGPATRPDALRPPSPLTGPSARLFAGLDTLVRLLDRISGLQGRGGKEGWGLWGASKRGKRPPAVRLQQYPPLRPIRNAKCARGHSSAEVAGPSERLVGRCDGPWDACHLAASDKPRFSLSLSPYRLALVRLQPWAHAQHGLVPHLTHAAQGL